MKTGRVLFRRLTQTDFNGMTGKAQQAGTGGGAMHVPLGVDTAAFPIREFLSAPSGAHKTISTVGVAGQYGPAQLVFDGNPARRNGEWRIADQFHHRHPAWTARQGFPTEYESDDPPVILVARIGDKYHARFRKSSAIKLGALSLFEAISGARNKGILDLQPDWAAYLDVLISQSPLKAAQEAAEEADAVGDFVPSNFADARKKTLSEVVRRQGQPKFRRELIKAYKSRCAITGCDATVVLEAAHITPYLGPQTNELQNGLLLRADFHTLFDLGLVTIDPTTMRVRVSSLLLGTEYGDHHNQPLSLPTATASRPSKAALEQHFKTFQP